MATSIDANELKDPVPRDTAGAREIGFEVPERYNASRLLFDNLDAGRADRTALICGDQTVTYGALAAQACQVGQGLAALSLPPFSRILVVVNDRPEYAAIFFGALHAGLVPVLVNTLSTADLLGFYLEDSSAPVVFIEAELLATLDAAITEGPGPEHVIAIGGAASDKATRWSDWIAPHASEMAPVDTDRDDMAFWMYSSGSTGRPKGIVHLHHDLKYTQDSYGAHFLALTADDRVFSVAKLFFAYGIGNSLTFPFSVGAAAILHPGRPEAGAVLDLIEQHRPTVFFGVPTLYVSLLAHRGSDTRDLSSIRLCISAAEPLPAETFDEWQRRYALEIVEGLGSTEVLHIYLSNQPGAVRLGTSGRRVPGYEVRLLDMEDQPVPKGETGNLWVRGDSTAPCYWNRADKTAETMRGEWIFTGDRFREDEEGNFHFDGRADDLIKVSGQWVYPMEIERCLAEHAAVHECAVRGVKDQRGLMTLHAHVCLRDGHAADDEMKKRLQDHAKSELVPYKYPRRVSFHANLPKTGTGKIDRQALKTDNT